MLAVSLITFNAHDEPSDFVLISNLFERIVIHEPSKIFGLRVKIAVYCAACLKGCDQLNGMLSLSATPFFFLILW